MNIRLILAALAAILLWPSVAMAADPTVVDLVASWGNWSVFVGVAVSLAIEGWRRFKPEVFDSFSPLAKRLVPLLVAGLSAGAVVAIAGADWSAIGVAALSAWGTALMAGDTLRVLLDALLRVLQKRRELTPAERRIAELFEPPPMNEQDLAKRIREQDAANAKPPGKPPIPPAAAMVFLLALGASGCTVIRPAVNAVDSVCSLGLAGHPLVQAAAEAKGWPLEQTASWLCGFPAVYDAWEQALSQRSADPAEAAVQVAMLEGLL